MQLNFSQTNRLADIDGSQLIWVNFEALGGKPAVGRGDEQFHLGIGLHESEQRFAVEMVGMIVARGGDVDEVKPLRFDHQLGHPRVRLVGGGVFAGERVGQVGVEQEVFPTPLGKKTALAKPPEVERVPLAGGIADVGKIGFPLKSRFDHARPSSLRTIATPSTMFCSFSLAAQRAVWLRPQSGAKDSRSAGACSRQRRTRPATSSAVSM